MTIQLNRREVIALAAAASAAAALPRMSVAQPGPYIPPEKLPVFEPPEDSKLGPLGDLGYDAEKKLMVLPKLPYAFGDLEPSIDAETMEIHHDRHHKAYVDNANKALEGSPLAALRPDLILTMLAGAPTKIREKLRNNVGGHVNHSMFWKLMAKPGGGDKGDGKHDAKVEVGGGEPPFPLMEAIKLTFGSFGAKDGFKDQFAAAATSRFGSGWAWLVARDKGLAICSTANQDNPLMGSEMAGCTGSPILGLDVWEHAYYLKYRNKRADYVTTWWNVVNWSKVAQLYAAAMK